MYKGDRGRRDRGGGQKGEGDRVASRSVGYHRYTSILFSPGKSISEVGSASRGWGGSHWRQISVSGKSPPTGCRATPVKLRVSPTNTRLPSPFAKGPGFAQVTYYWKTDVDRRGWRDDYGWKSVELRRGANLPDDLVRELGGTFWVCACMYVCVHAPCISPCACSPYWGKLRRHDRKSRRAPLSTRGFPNFRRSLFPALASGRKLWDTLYR